MKDIFALKDFNLFDRKKSPIIISSRVRLARNFKSTPFSSSASVEVLDKVLSESQSALKSTTQLKKNDFLRMDNLSDSEKLMLLENRLISNELFENTNSKGALVLSKDCKLCVMINEEDHLRLQAIEKGFALEDAWASIDALDTAVSKKINYAFDKSYGFLTACPSNAGTGMRASVMMHLPALAIAELMEKIVKGLNQLGVTVRGANGEGSDFLCSMFQISNQQTLGLSEQDIIEKISKLVKKVEKFELDARRKMLKENPKPLHDKIARAWGLLNFCEIINSREALNCLSMLRMGVNLGFIKDNSVINALINNVQPAHLLEATACELSEPSERDILRAKYIKSQLSKVKPPSF